MADAPRKGGKKGRKVGRQRKSPSHIRYTNEKRWVANKKRKVARNLKKQKRNHEYYARGKGLLA